MVIITFSMRALFRFFMMLRPGYSKMFKILHEIAFTTYKSTNEVHKQTDVTDQRIEKKNCARSCYLPTVALIR